MILVFDLDDTLYDELTYVRSGFRSVAKYLNRQLGIPEEEAYKYMADKLTEGRGAIFNETLKHFGFYNKMRVQKCISVYRLHQPQILLYPEAAACLRRFRTYPIYIVTDGHKIVQENKIKALGLDKIIKHDFITHRHGRHNAKPSPYCFKRICLLERAEPSEVVYIGDNPNKDFIGINNLGFQTVRLLKGQYRDVRLTTQHEAKTEISSLDELTEKLLNSLRD